MTSIPPPAGDQSGDGDGDGDQTSRPPGSVGTFLAALGEEIGPAGLTPAALGRAVVRVLPVDGAGLSMLVSVLRVPLGASSEAAGRAEELQSSLGEGPCLDAAEAQATIVVDLDDLEARWTLYGEELLATTPFRAVASVPLSAPGYGVLAALDLYSVEPRLSDSLRRGQVEEIAAAAGALLSTCIEQIHDVDAPASGPDWYRAAAARRHDVTTAIGMVMARRAGRTSDALSLLRAHAFATNRSLDDTAGDIVGRRLPLSDLTD